MQSRPPPPLGYTTWRDFAVENVDLHSVQLERRSPDREADREAAFDAICSELRELRVRAGRPDTGPKGIAATFDVPIHRNEIKLLSVQEFAQMNAGDAEANVRQRLNDEMLFQVSINGKTGLPSFQAWRTVAGNPLEAVLIHFRRQDDHKIDGLAAYGFFVSISDLLHYLAPLELLLGGLVSERRTSKATIALLARPVGERLDIVLRAARTERERYE